MKNLELKYRKLLRRIFGCVSFTAVAFVFQACYGTKEYPPPYEVRFIGTVKSSITILPIEGIKVTINGGFGMGITDKNGNFEFYTRIESYNQRDSVSMNFLDIDSTQNGYFADTTISVPARKE